MILPVPTQNKVISTSLRKARDNMRSQAYSDRSAAEQLALNTWGLNL